MSTADQTLFSAGEEEEEEEEGEGEWRRGGVHLLIVIKHCIVYCRLSTSGVNLR